MARLLLIAVFVGLALARPETYREKEDFQYSRSSSDEGSKSGFYGAQRGNMGGNYEKAHNMDNLAQKQMSTAVNQVTGELGDTRDMNVGSVFTAANTRGVYGQGQYDLSNLQGRNFEETGSFGGNSEASSLHSGYGSHSLHNSGFTGEHSAYSGGHSAFSGHNSRYTGYHAADAETLHKNNLQALDQVSNGYREHGRQSGYGSESRSYSGNQASIYDQQHSNLYAADRQYATKNRLVGANGAPVRIVIRPGSTLNVPVAAETFEDRQTSAASSHDSVNRDVEVIANPETDHVVVRPTGASKHYESSYKYQKEWEKHDTKPVPLAIPTGIPQNRELYDDVQSTVGSEFHGNSIASSDYQAAANSHYQAQSQYNTQRHSGAYGAHNDAYTGAYRNGALVGVGSVPAPKKYESAYSYHKSWERQGDPYVIEPVHPVPADSQRLTAATNHQAYGSHQYGSQYKSSHQSYTKSGALVDCDCDDDTHSRVARSVDSINQRNYDYNPYQQNSKQQEELTQQVQSENYEKLRKHEGWNRNSERLGDLGQQTQNQWDNLEQFGRSTQAQAEDLGQQTQDAWGNLESVNRGESLKHNKDMNEHVIPVWEQSQDDSQHTLVHAVNSAENGPYFRPTMGRVNFPMYSPEIGETLNHHSYAHSAYEESKLESHQHDNTEKTMHEYKPENQNNNQSPLQSVWDRIDGLQQTLKSNSDSLEKEHWHGYDQHDLHSQSFMQNWHRDNGFMQNSQHDQNDFRWHTGQVPSQDLLPPITDKTSDVTSTTLKPFANHDDKKPKDIGRGDIGDDDLTNGVTQPTENKPTTQIYTSPSTQQTKPFKTPAEIDALSLIKEQEKQAENSNHGAQSRVHAEHANTQSDSGLGVISLSMQKNRENNYFRSTANSNTNIHKENHDTEKANRESFKQDNQSSNSDSSIIARHEIIRENQSKHEDNNDYHGNFDQQFLNMFHEAMAEQEESGVYDQHTSDQFEHLGQETVSLNVPVESLSMFDTQKTQSQEPEYLGQETVKFDLPSESLSSFDKHNKQIHSMGQETEFNSGAHTFESQHSLSQQPEFLGQETVKFDLPSESLSSSDKHNTQINSMGQETEFNSGSHTFESKHIQSHQREYIGQETEKLDNPSESLHTFGTQKSQDEDLSQQSVSLLEFLHSLNDKHENLDQQSFSGFDKHTDHQSEDLGQHTVDLHQQDQQDFNKYVYDPSDKSKNIEQAEDVQVQTNFDARSSLQVPQEDNFYKERYVANSGAPTDPKSSQDNVEAKPSETEVAATVTEVTTERPGFWKSVGNKFVSAKDKVSSWFSKS